MILIAFINSVALFEEKNRILHTCKILKMLLVYPRQNMHIGQADQLRRLFVNLVGTIQVFLNVK